MNYCYSNIHQFQLNLGFILSIIQHFRIKLLFFIDKHIYANITINLSFTSIFMTLCELIDIKI